MGKSRKGKGGSNGGRADRDQAVLDAIRRGSEQPAGSAQERNDNVGDAIRRAVEE